MGSWIIKYGLWHKPWNPAKFARENSPLIDFVLARLSSGHRSGVIWAESVSPESSLTATWSAYFLFPEPWHHNPNIISCWALSPDRRALSSSLPLLHNSVLPRSTRQRDYYTLPYREQLSESVGWECEMGATGWYFYHWQLPLSISRIVSPSFWSTPILSVVGCYPRIVGCYRLGVGRYRLNNTKT